ncbi:hypothetical protein E2C01_077928 [Portunus trituberculatus]|uniref:Uncharacterized protein n=1 Tax=Portunus trituberculatus TaxID=210409 RepID=A0A5B7ILI6_PORTR|nr:hypothetical protein [Portunus trituberculatus]
MARSDAWEPTRVIGKENDQAITVRVCCAIGIRQNIARARGRTPRSKNGRDAPEASRHSSRKRRKPAADELAAV